MPRIRPRISITPRGINVGVSLTWAGTHANLTLDHTGFQSRAIDLSEQINTRLDRNVNNVVVQTVRGQIKCYVNPTAADTLTRLVVSLGIVWADASFVTVGGSDENPNPLLDSMKWMWRHNYPIAFASNKALLAADNYRDPGSTIDVNVKVKRRQPSLEHHLFLFAAVNSSPAPSNTTSVSILSSTNLLLKLP